MYIIDTAKHKKRVLLVTAKWPVFSPSTDGGDSTVREIIEAIGRECSIDLMCFRKDQMKCSLYGINKIIIYNYDIEKIYNYERRDGIKFLSRLACANIIKDAVERIEHEYDIVILQHCLFSFGLAANKELMAKTVLFPMFTGTSYIMSGENVPQEYIDAEKEALPRIGRIISPSYTEARMLIKDYNVHSDRLFIIPRSVNFSYVPRSDFFCDDVIHMVYVASVRMQKSHIDAVKLVKDLTDSGMNVHLLCIGTIQDNTLYNECLEYIERNELEKRVEFCGSKTQEELRDVFFKTDINISVSKWETFGRGIHEGMAMGVPTVIPERIECVKASSNIDCYPLIAANEKHMKDIIISLYNDREFYMHESQKGRIISKLLSKKKIYAQLAECILG